MNSRGQIHANLYAASGPAALPGLFTWLLLVTGSASADDARRQALEAGKEYGRNQHGTVLDSVQNPALETMIPAYEGSDVPEIDYGGMGLGIKDAARLRLPGNAPGMHVYDSALARPKFTLDLAQDPLLQKSREIGAHPERIIGGLAGEYSGCKTVPATVAAVADTEQSCTAWQARQHDCTQQLSPQCMERGACAGDGGALELLPASHNDVVWQYQYPTLVAGNPAGEAWMGSQHCGPRGGPRSYLRRFRFNVPSLERIEEFRLARVHYEDHISIRLNGQVVFGPGALSFGSRSNCHLVHPFFGCGAAQSHGTVCQDRNGGPCRPFSACDCYRRCCTTYWGVNGGSGNCNTGERQTTPSVDLKPHLVAGENVLEMQVMVSGTGRGWFQVQATQNCCTQWRDVWSACAATTDANCAQAPGDTRCLDAQGTRIVGGERLQRDCWRRQTRYTCLGGDTYTEEPYCRELRARGCTQTGSYCVDTEAGGCAEYEQRYSCPAAPATAGTLLQCDDQVYCLGEDCFAAGYETSEDFPLAASHLGMVEEAVRDMDPDSLSIFSGTARKCKKTVLGFSNCCRASGWGVNLGLARCSAGERALGEQRAAGQCHYVGSYKTGSLFSRKRYQAFCCFNSKLGRIVQQQGRAQLGIAWGGARSPQCRGYTPQELGTIDFERIDFAEFYDDALTSAAQVSRPSATELGRRLEAALRQRLEP